MAKKKRMEAPKSTKLDPAGLTIRQRKYVNEYIRNGGRGKQAMLAATDYPIKEKTAESTSSQYLSNPKVRSEIIKALDRAGLDEEFIAKSIKTQITSGLGVDAKASDANRALEALIRMRDTSNMLKKDSKANSVHFHITTDINKKTPRELSEEGKKYRNMFDSIVENGEILDDETTP